MASSLSRANCLFTQLLSLTHRRGYGVASDVSVRGALDGIVNRSNRRMVGKVEEKGAAKNDSEAFSSAWVPDPVTGYYRPINQTNEIDPVELRKMLLNHKGRSSSSSP